MVWFSYHGGHSGTFCRHAKGELADVVAAAWAAGFSTYGLSEHCPRWEAGHLYPDESDLTPDDLRQRFTDYVTEARRLQASYEGRMEILVGFETEVLPSRRWPSLMRQLRREHAFDYVVGSVHSIDETWIDLDESLTDRVAERLGGWEELCVAYFDQLVDLIQTLEPEVVGHVDLVRRFRGDNVEFGPRVFRRVERVLECAKAVGAALEVNAAPARRKFGPVYPSRQILRRAREMGVRVTLGDDSHGPHDVGGGLEACRNAIAAAGYYHVHYLTRKGGTVEFAVAPITEVKPALRGQC